jgi:plastocyanin
MMRRLHQLSVALFAAVTLVAAATFIAGRHAPAWATNQETVVSNAVEHIVEIGDFEFAPSTLQVRPGDTIIWKNLDIVPHTVTASDKSWDSGTIAKGASYRHVVTAGETTAYFCRFHPSMTGAFEIAVDG